MRSTFIYVLIDPRDRQVRYVGKSVRPASRLREHLQRARLGRASHLYCWIRSIGAIPDIEVIDEVPDSDWQVAERFWIAYLRMVGADLVNATEGGEGIGQNPSPEVRRKMGANKGRVFSADVRLKMSLARMGRKPSKRTISALIERNKSIPFSDERRRKIGDAQRGKKISPEHRAALSAAHSGKKKPREFVEKLRKLSLERMNSEDEVVRILLKKGSTPAAILADGNPLASVARVLGVSRYIAKSMAAKCE